MHKQGPWYIYLRHIMAGPTVDMISPKPPRSEDCNLLFLSLSSGLSCVLFTLYCRPLIDRLGCLNNGNL